MNEDRHLFRWAGGCAIIYGVLQVVSFTILFLGRGLATVSMEEPTPEVVLSTYQNPGFQISQMVALIAFFFLFPALIGLVVLLKNHSKGLGLVGFAFGAVAFITLLISNCLQSGLVHWIDTQGKEASEILMRDIYLINNLAKFLRSPAMILALFFYLLWGSAFRKMGGLARLTGDFFLLEIIFFIWTSVCIALRLQILANIGILVQTVVIAIAFIMAGLVVFARARVEIT